MNKEELHKAEKSDPWRVNLAGLLEELGGNPQTASARVPINIAGKLLSRLGEVAIRINDPELNCLMLRLAIYSVGAPGQPDFSQEKTTKYLKENDPLYPKYLQ